MKLAFLLFIFLISLSKCYIIKKVPYDMNTTLSTSSTNTNYFYLDSKEFSRYNKLYLYFHDKSYNLDYNLLQICYTDEKSTISLQNCSFTTKTPFHKVTSSSYNEYCYEINTKNASNVLKTFIIVHYSGSTTYGSLSVKALKDNLYNKNTHNSESAFGTLANVFIIIFGITTFVCIIVAIVFCYLCSRKKTIPGIVGYPKPQPNYIISDNAAYPLNRES